MEDSETRQFQIMLNRYSIFHILYSDKTLYPKILCRTSSSSIYVKTSRKGSYILWDLRLIEFINHAFIGLNHFDDLIQIRGGSKTKGQFHLISLILFRIAEKGINPEYKDFNLSSGILFHNSLYFHNSAISLVKHSNSTIIDDIDKEMNALNNKIFNEFIFQHELAHNTFKTKRKDDYLNDVYLTKISASKKWIDMRHNILKEKLEPVNEEILRIYESVENIINNKALFEEIFADTYALDIIFKKEIQYDNDVPMSIVFYYIIRSVLTGLTSLRLLGLSEIILKSKNEIEFESLLISHKQLYNTRKIFIESFVGASIASHPEILELDANESEDFEFNRIHKLSQELFMKTLSIEEDIKEKFINGFFNKLRNEGRKHSKKHCLTENNLRDLFLEKLGWQQFDYL